MEALEAICKEHDGMEATIRAGISHAIRTAIRIILSSRPCMCSMPLDTLLVTQSQRDLS